jgi:Flp pilus assembly pilin Flp
MLDIVRHYLRIASLRTGKAQGLVEYALIVVLISLASIAILTTLGNSIVSVFSQANTGLGAP